MEGIVIQSEPNSQNITRAVYDYVATLNDGDQITSQDVWKAVKNVDDGVKISNVAAAMFHLRNEGAIEVIKTTRAENGVGRAYLYKIIKAKAHEGHVFRDGIQPRGITRNRLSMKERASQLADRILAEARIKAEGMIASARRVAAETVSGDAPLSATLGIMAMRAATQEAEMEALVANAKAAAERPSGILLSEASLPQIIAEMARRM